MLNNLHEATIDRSNWLMLGRWDRLKRCEDRLCWDCTLPELQKYTSVGKREARWIYIEELKNVSVFDFILPSFVLN